METCSYKYRETLFLLFFFIADSWTILAAVNQRHIERHIASFQCLTVFPQYKLQYSSTKSLFHTSKYQKQNLVIFSFWSTQRHYVENVRTYVEKCKNVRYMKNSFVSFKKISYCSFSLIGVTRKTDYLTEREWLMARGMVSIILSHDSMSHTYHTKLLITDYYDVLGCFCLWLSNWSTQEYLRKKSEGSTQI